MIFILTEFSGKKASERLFCGCHGVKSKFRRNLVANITSSSTVKMKLMRMLCLCVLGNWGNVGKAAS